MVNNDADEVLRAVAYAQSFFTNIKPGIIIRKGVSDFETESIIASIVFRCESWRDRKRWVQEMNQQREIMKILIGVYHFEMYGMFLVMLKDEGAVFICLPDYLNYYTISQ